MNYYASKKEMAEKVDRVLYRHAYDDIYTLDDIVKAIHQGTMQSFVKGDTWAITQIIEFPQKKVLEIAFVIGKIEDAIELLPEIYEHAKSVGATRVTGFGREGWGEFLAPGWRKVGTMYAKDL